MDGEAQVLYSEEHGDLTYDTVVIQVSGWDHTRECMSGLVSVLHISN